MNARVEVALAAAVGGVTPPLLRLAVRLTSDEQSTLALSAGYFVGLVLFAGIGYLVAVFWNETVPRRALYLGLGLPALLQVGITAHNKAAQQSTLEIFSTTAYAQSSPQADDVVPPTLMTSYHRKLSLAFDKLPSDTRIVFTALDGTRQSIVPDWSRAAASGRVDLVIPKDAATLSISSAFTRNTPTITLLKKNDQSLRLQMETDFTAGFLKALGFDAADALKVTNVSKIQAQ